MADEQAVHDVIAHVEAQTESLKRDLLANKVQAADTLASDLPAGSQGTLAHGIGQVAGGIVGGAGEVIGGVASAGADAVGAVGSVADAVHEGVNSFFSNLRKHLGI